jgi:uncharacterized protein (TIGR02145 family)
MKPLLSLLLAPTLALCGTFSGTVVALDGTPIVGATIKAGTDSVTTTTNGTWSLARSAGIASRSGKTIPVTSHLTVENGRPRLSFGGMDISGRSHASGSPAVAKGSVEGRQAITARTAADRDTLRVYWKGKRLTVLTVPSDTGSITFKIDTAWKDDAEIPWNPRISYGSLVDARDGQTYRTVTIGAQTWMAENLNFDPDSAWLYKNSPDSGTNRGRGYIWTTAMRLPDSCGTKTCTTLTLPKHRGTCPLSWHVPSIDEWLALNSYVIANVNPRTGTMLKSTKGWNGTGVFATRNGTDHYGFRALPTNPRNPDGTFPDFGTYCWWWTTSSGVGRSYADYASMFSLSFDEVSSYGRIAKSAQYSLRCVLD